MKEKLDDGSYVFDRQSLCDKEVIQYMAGLVEEGLGVGVTPLNVQQAIQQYETQGAICLYEVATSMDHFVSEYSCPKDRYSTRMENEIHRYEYEHS
ncbi:hypothetical protein [Haloplanus halophilus]|uniref:hypothetical protein n=1 Tax=Haloplanus halophilus TaxID=2949993 RepID=UPI00203DF61C|nr:hypothetical protein [Haloplanus sp. GDY1]